MNTNTKLDIAYIAGIFDAKGTIRSSRSSILGKVWKMEICIADKSIMELIPETLEGGLIFKKKVNGKNQWSWICRNQDCFFVAKALWPHVIIKLHKIEQIIDYYDPHIQDLDDNIIELDRFRDNIWFGKKK